MTKVLHVQMQPLDHISNQDLWRQLDLFYPNSDAELDIGVIQFKILTKMTHWWRYYLGNLQKICNIIGLKTW